MLSIKPISNGESYHFYLQVEAAGEWVGTGSEILGLPQPVSAEEFDAMRRGVHPETGEKLRILDPADRVYKKPWGLETYRAREMYDLTISAPKSVSVQGLIDARMQDAHRQAVREIQHNMEHLCGAMVIAKYEHAHSRKLDPQIHTHLVAANLAYKGADWRTLGANDLYRRNKDITADYRQRLHEMLERWGYDIEGIEIAGISPEVAERYSQRATQIKEQLGILGLDNATTGEQHVVANRHRPPKPKLAAEELREYQLSRLTPAERDTLIRVRDEALNRSEKLNHAEREAPRLKLDDQPHYEPALRRQTWDYSTGYRNGPRMRF